MIRRAQGIGLGVSLALLAAACTKNIDEGTQIKEIAATEEKPAPAMPVAPTQQVRPDAQRALENYEKLLDLPQDPTARAETMRRLADLQLELDEASGGTNLAQSEARLRRSVELYNTVLTEHPDAPTNDRVLYQLARAYQSLGELAKGEEALLRLTRDYPASLYVDDAYFRRAELLFRLEQFDEAAADYQKVLAQKEASPFFESAQYKYGWAEYRQSNYVAALGVFLTILNRELPAGEQTDLKVAIDGVRAGKKDMAQDALRVVGLALTQLGGSEAATQYFAKHGEPPYSALIYAGLGTTLLEKKRYTDSAKAYEAYVAAHPQHALVPQFLGKAIAAQELGGFIEPVVAAKERYVAHLDPGAAYWQGRAPNAEVMVSLRSHLEDLARYYQARGQKPRDEGTAPAKDDFEEATRWYQRLLALFPQDPKAAELRFLMAESMFDAGDTVGAAREYSRVVAEHPNYEKAPDAAFAALLAYQRNTEAVPPAQRDAALRQSVEAGLQLAEKYPQHPQALAALTRAAEDLYRLHEYDRAVAVAQRTLAVQPPAPDDLRRTAWQVTADAHFSQKRYAPAEAAYAELLPLVPADAANRGELTERQASSIYKQGEAARDASDFGTAAEAFLRVGRVVPGASIRATADYDAATMLIAKQDWAQAAVVLEAFRTAYATSALLPEVDKKLAVVYEKDNRPHEAAAAYARIAARPGEAQDIRREAAWQAATLFDKSKDEPATTQAYEFYIKNFVQPVDRALDARMRLAEIYQNNGNRSAYLRIQQDFITADAFAGSERSDKSKTL
ncbi:MAG TPA: tetratricopeptide repeat protein, partial [Verrucomicrobiae bacterium]|nr:tetratricopeptide repeat protein [Verrucomicrobiae bacterium]